MLLNVIDKNVIGPLADCLVLKDSFWWNDVSDLVTFTEEILNGKLHFLCSEMLYVYTVSGTIQLLTSWDRVVFFHLNEYTFPKICYKENDKEIWMKTSVANKQRTS